MAYANPADMRAWRDAHRVETAAYHKAYNATHRDRLAAQSRERYAKRRDIIAGISRETRLRSYGLSRETFDAMLAAQGGVCAVCGGQEPARADGRSRSFHVDHDHSCCPGRRSCGKCVRGLLCQTCNAALGLFNDDPARLRAAADYLER